MEFDVEISTMAEKDLDDIVSYISIELMNPKAGASFLDKIEETIIILQRFPESGFKIKNVYVINKEVRKMIVGKYGLLYVLNHKKRRIEVL